MKNIVIGVLAIVSVASLYFGYTQSAGGDELAICESQADELKKQSEQYKTEVAELQKMYDQAIVEMKVQRTICEEQLKALNSN